MGAENQPLWMDVGCGDGALSMTAADFGFHSASIDAREGAGERIRALGFNAQQGNFVGSSRNWKK